MYIIIDLIQIKNSKGKTDLNLSAKLIIYLDIIIRYKKINYWIK
jgi:FtsH-binding integral membrane protein